MLNSEISAWIANVTGYEPTQVEPVTGGKNNQAFRILCDKNWYFVKHYFSDPEYKNARFLREVAFYRLLNDHHIPSITKLIVYDEKSNIALFNYIEGKNIQDCSEAHLKQAAAFVHDINRPEIHGAAQNLDYAKGYLFEPKSFFDDIKRRFDVLKLTQIQGEVGQDFKAYLNQQLAPKIQSLEGYAEHAPDLHPFKLILSPSDFGFHNALENSKLMFFDFEYAGWDSAEKLITDFFSQPRHYVDSQFLEKFIEISFPADKNQELLNNCKYFLPLAKFKWALIFLNEFNQLDSCRRSFSGLNLNYDDYLKQQILKSKHKLLEVDI
jgi:hypothetical protein